MIKLSLVTIVLVAIVVIQEGHSAAVNSRVDIKKCRVSNCGKPGPKFLQPRIIGGRLAKEDEFPFHAVITTKPLPPAPGRTHQKTIKCSGNMINDQWILTTAECVWDHPAEDLRVSVAILGIGEESDNVIAVEKVLLHPQFDPDDEHHDIALLKLAKSIKASSQHFVNPICLPFDDLDSEDVTVATVAGFGSLDEYTEPQDYLHTTTLPIQADSVCTGVYFDKFNSTSMICAGDMRGKRDTCFGDSGGPLAFRKNGSYVLKGLVSFGLGCARKNVPAVYTKVSHYLEWTCETMLQNGYQSEDL